MAVRTPRKADLSGAPDRRLAALAAGRDEAAFEAIFERHHRGLLSLCRYLLGSLEEAEDAVQHTFAAAYRQLVEREPPMHLRAWLYATARNRCLDVLRTRRELPAEHAPASTAGLSEEVERRSDLRELVDDIGRLPEDQRAALVMSEIDELEHSEVAEVLGCPRDKVRALVYQARSSLSGWREARALPCREVRQELSVARGGALRRGHLRRHLKLCPECAEFRQDVDRQRRQVALVLPVFPALGFMERVLEAAWGAAGAGGGAGLGSAAGGGGLAGSLGPTAIKIGAAALLLGGGVATFVGFTGDGPVENRPVGEPPSERFALSERRDVAAMGDPLLEGTSKQLRARAVAALGRSESDQPGGSAAAQGSDATGASPQPAPESPQADATQAPGATQDAGTTQGAGTVPRVRVEADVGVDVGGKVGADVGAEVEVEPPAGLP